MMHIIKLTLAIALTVLLVIFCVANREFVSVNFFPLPYSAEMPKSLLLILCLMAGIIIGGLCGSMAMFRQKRCVRQEKIRAAALSNELNTLRMENDQRTSAPLL